MQNTLRRQTYKCLERNIKINNKIIYNYFCPSTLLAFIMQKKKTRNNAKKIKQTKNNNYKHKKFKKNGKQYTVNSKISKR